MARAKSARTKQSHNISHIDTVISDTDAAISHIEPVTFHIDTVILGSFPYRYCHLVILGQDDHVISCHSGPALVDGGVYLPGDVLSRVTANGGMAGRRRLTQSNPR